MFGKNRIHRIIRQNHQASAKEILTECFRALNRFMENHASEDDVTMIVIKMIDD
jgi:serine phosphatase RsbU (regulator of sigma subunit)